MTPDEARDRMSDALEGALSESEQKQFDEALLASDELQSEFAALKLVMKGTQMLRSEVPETPEILAGVQAKLRKRSRGRFYRDRFAEGEQRGTMVLVAMTTVVLLLVAWYLASTVIPT